MKSSYHGFPVKTIIAFCFVLNAFLQSATAQCTATDPNITLHGQGSVNAFRQAYGCSVIEGTLEIRGTVTNLDSLIDITRVGSLAISQTTLPNLDGLQGLTKVDRFLSIVQNPQLVTLEGLENLTETGDLYLDGNVSLTDINGLSGLTKTIAFEQNGYEYGNISLYGNNALSSLEGLNNLQHIDGGLHIQRMNFLLSLNGLNGLETVKKDVLIKENSMLQNLSGLDNLSQAGSVRIQQNESLYSLTGLSNLTTVQEGVIIFLNLALVDLGNLEKLKHVGKQFKVIYNPLIQSLQGLHIETVTGGNPLTFDDGLVITQTKITDMRGLDGLEKIDGWFYIGQNIQLKTLDGLDNLQYLNGGLGIEDNIMLESIDAIADLEYINGELELSDNDSLQFCSVPSICRYLDAPAGLVLIWGNKPGCQSPEEIQSNCSPIVEFNLIDANLEIDDSPMTTGDIRDLPLADLATLDKLRAAVSTDGISTVLIKLVTGNTGRMTMSNPSEEGFEFPWGDTTHLINGKNYLYFLYTPPDEFDEFQDVFLYGDGVEAYNLDYDFEYIHDQQVRTDFFTITHVRPPVVLMHGTYSDPDQAWKSAASEGISMYDRLVSEGFKVFTVNYKETNGTTGFITDNTSFGDNAKVLWGDVYPLNTGGIKDALTHYRDSLDVAITQVDVVGHSLGGVLPRVYASAQYNPDYKRAENFMEGDINRLITLGSTHFGSNLGELQVFLDDIAPWDIGALDWLALQGVNLITQWVGGASASNAVIDQIPPPMGSALGLLGRTEIPSHAITLRVPNGELKDSIYDPDESYYDMYWYTTTLMYQVRDVRTEYLDGKLALLEEGHQASTTLTGENPQELYPLYDNYMLYKSMIEDGIQRAGMLKSVLDGTFELPTDIEIYKYALGETGMADFADPLVDIFVAGADPVGVALDYVLPEIQFPTVTSIIEDQLKVTEASMEALRSLIFNNDDNDGVVRVQSQSGELEKECPECVTNLDHILHGFAPRYPMVQDRLVELLRSDMSLYNEAGFPPVDHAQKIYYPPQSLELFKVPTGDGAAICQSGLAPSHARAFAHVADANNVIIITRPVNPDATILITHDAATKAMNVKPKSSNWGPQKGYLPVQQRYSKLWKIFTGEERNRKIHTYDSLAQYDLAHGITVGRELIIPICNDMYKIYIDENKIEGPGDGNAEDEVVLVPLSDPSSVCSWGPEFSSDQIITDCEPISDEHQLISFQVMASALIFDEDGNPRYLTSDYDLLMIGFYEGMDQGDPDPPVVPLRPVVGQATPQQETLMAKLNAAVDGTGYSGGKVVHHGPENQYNESPYIDYPLTVFAPDHIPNGLFNTSTNGLILSIEIGPPGFRDINLKQFVNRMRNEGYDLYHNPAAPGWKWTWDSDAEAYHLEDSKNLPDYVEQLPKNDCDKNGGKKLGSCPTAQNPDEASNEKPGPSGGNRSATTDISFRISPTIVYDQNVTLTIDMEKAESFSWMIVDPMGKIRESGKIGGNQKHIDLSVDVSKLATGMYTVVTDLYGQIGRIIKM